MKRIKPEITRLINQDDRVVLRIIIAGDSGVGKTTLIERYISKKFIADTSMTIGVQFHLNRVIYKGFDMVLQIWDFGGNERFRHLLPTYSKDAKGAFLTFDLSRERTIEMLESSWLPILRRQDTNLPVILVGTKYDLVDPNSPAIDPDFGRKFVSRNNLQGYIETSSKTGVNIDKAVAMLVKYIIEEDDRDSDELNVVETRYICRRCNEHVSANIFACIHCRAIYCLKCFELLKKGENICLTCGSELKDGDSNFHLQ